MPEILYSIGETKPSDELSVNERDNFTGSLKGEMKISDEFSVKVVMLINILKQVHYSTVGNYETSGTLPYRIASRHGGTCNSVEFSSS